MYAHYSEAQHLPYVYCCRENLFLDYSLLVNSRDVDCVHGLWIFMWVAGEKQTFWIIHGTKILLTHVNEENVLLPNEKQSHRNFPHILWTYKVHILYQLILKLNGCPLTVFF